MKAIGIILALFCLYFGFIDPISADSKTKSLEGTFYLSGKTLLDPSPEEPKDTHFVIQLNGESARTLFESMKVKPQRDIILDDGSMMKQIQNMQCTQSPDKKKHECSFSIDVKNQRIDLGSTC